MSTIGELTEPRRPVARGARRWIGVCVLLGSLVLLVYVYAVPRFVEIRLRKELAAHGYPDAKLRVARVGLWHIDLAEVRLGAGLDLGHVTLDAGLSLLWGDPIEEISIRGARISSTAFAHAPGAGGSLGAGTLPFTRVRIEDTTLAVRDTLVSVAGTVAWGAQLQIDLDTTISVLRLGGVTARSVAGRLRGRGERVSACFTGEVDDARAYACAHGELSGSGRYAGHLEVFAPTASIATATMHLASLSAEVTGDLDALELRGELRAPTIALRDRFQTSLVGTRVPLVVRADLRGAGALRSVRPLVVLARRATLVAAGAQLVAERATVTVPAGTREPPEIAWTADHLSWNGIRLRDASGTISTRTELVRWRAAQVVRAEIAMVDASGTVAGDRLTWRARRARWSEVEVSLAAGSVDLSRQVGSWSAHSGRWGRARFTAPRGVVSLDPSRADHVAWRALSGPLGIELGEGELAYRTEGQLLHLEHGRVDAIGGQLIVDPLVATLGAPADVVLRARGLKLALILDKLGRGRVRATGLVDGELTMHVADSGCSLRRGLLRTRGHGTVQIRDARLRQRITRAATGFAVEARVAAALTDFRYAQLAAVVGSPGRGPDLRIWTRGRGATVPQDLDLVITMRGVRDATDHLASRAKQQEQ